MFREEGIPLFIGIEILGDTYLAIAVEIEIETDEFGAAVDSGVSEDDGDTTGCVPDGSQQAEAGIARVGRVVEPACTHHPLRAHPVGAVLLLAMEDDIKLVVFRRHRQDAGLGLRGPEDRQVVFKIIIVQDFIVSSAKLRKTPSACSIICIIG